MHAGQDNPGPLGPVIAQASTPPEHERGRHLFFRRPWLLTILLASALCVAYLIGVIVNWADAADRSLYANLGMIPIGFAATVVASKAAKAQTDPRSQWAWRLLAAGLACFFAGDVLFFVYENVIGRSPFPSLADAGYLTYYPLVFAGMLCLPRASTVRRRRSLIHFGCVLVVVAAAACVVGLYLIPTLQASRDDLFAYSLSAGYPVGDLLLLGGVAWALLRGGTGKRRGILLLSTGLVVGLAADVLYGYQNIQGTFESGGLADAAYMISWALFAWGGYAEFSRRWMQSSSGARVTQEARSDV